MNDNKENNIIQNEKDLIPLRKLEIQLRVNAFTERLRVINKYYPNGIKWTCNKCTFINEKLVFQCEICETEKEYE
jgi:rubrerythrin